MDPVSLIVGALATGTAQGVGEAATAAVKEAYTELKRLVSARFMGRGSAEIVLAEHDGDPDTWQAPLAKELRETGAADDQAVVEAAQRLMDLLDHAGSRAGKYTVDLRGAQGVQVGEGNRQINRFTAPPPGP